MDRAHLANHPAHVETTGRDVVVDGVVETDRVLSVREFTAPDVTTWRRVWLDGTPRPTTHAASDVETVQITQAAAQACSLAYFREVLDHLPSDDYLHRTYRGLTRADPRSALALYLAGRLEAAEPWTQPVIYPFRSNASQREAVPRCLGQRISVVDGPPGTGKTETILNIIANIVAADRGTVGIVSFSNSAVENVRDKMVEAEYAHLLVDLRKREHRDAFFSSLGSEPPPSAPQDGDDPADLSSAVAARVDKAQRLEKELASARVELAGLQVERDHFEAHTGSTLPDVRRLRLFRKSSERILEYLADLAVERGRLGFRARVERYFRFGRLKNASPEESEYILEVQRAYYTRAIQEHERLVAQLERRVARSGVAELAEELQTSSTRILSQAVARRLASAPPVPAGTDGSNYRRRDRFEPLVRRRPVVLSTCHSLRSSLPRGTLLDYLIVDEASQVDLLSVVAAMDCCRHLIVVGDERQLPQISQAAARTVPAPHPAYDYSERSILTSLTEVHGGNLPRTQLIEHYRCHPDIINFCNAAFYGGVLVPFRTTSPDDGPRTFVHRTVEGNHARKTADGRPFNQREVRAIEELLAEAGLGDLGLDVAAGEVAVTTPFRAQADLAGGLTSELIGRTDTVHKMQGGQHRAVILSTVISETREGGFARKFADTAHLVNVAVSRAQDYLIVVTNHDKVPRTKNLRNLIGYIEYRNLDATSSTSEIVSVFDILYAKFNEKLDDLAARR